LVRLTQEGYVSGEVIREVRTRSFTVAEDADILEARETPEAALAGKAAERATRPPSALVERFPRLGR
jgi:DNA-binding GntR family transcriptional regulator